MGVDCSGENGGGEGGEGEKDAVDGNVEALREAYVGWFRGDELEDVQSGAVGEDDVGDEPGVDA